MENKIYLTEEGKKELEVRIAELEESYGQYSSWEEKYGELQTLKEILSSATILPVESNMSYVKSYDFVDEFDTEYPQGVIIQPKQ